MDTPENARKPRFRYQPRPDDAELIDEITNAALPARRIAKCAPVHRGAALSLYDQSMLEEAPMRQSLMMAFAATLVFGVSASAQDGDLSGVTMRVLDDVSDVDAVILELDANRGEGEDASERGGGGSDDASAAEREAAEPATPDRFDEPRKELHDPDDDERSEGKLEDNDVEQPAPAP